MKQNRKSSSREIRKARKQRQREHDAMLKHANLNGLQRHIYETTRGAA